MDDNNKVSDNNDTINNMYNDPNYTIKETDLGTQISHPAYGMLAFSRITGGNQSLFGSSIKHHDIIGMTIRHGDVTRGLNKDWYHGSDEIILARPISQFFSGVDTVKYPNIKQKYRFELIKHMDSEIHNSMITHCNLTPPQRKTHV